MSYKENAHANKLHHHGYSQKNENIYSDGTCPTMGTSHLCIIVT